MRYEINTTDRRAIKVGLVDMSKNAGRLEYLLEGFLFRLERLRSMLYAPFEQEW